MNTTNPKIWNPKYPDIWNLLSIILALKKFQILGIQIRSVQPACTHPYV